MFYEWPTLEWHGGKPYVRLVSLTTHPHKFSHFSGFERKNKDSGLVSGRYPKQKVKNKTHKIEFWEQRGLNIRDCTLLCVLLWPRVEYFRHPSGSENIRTESFLTLLLFVVRKHFSNGLTFNIWSNTPTRTWKINWPERMRASKSSFSLLLTLKWRRMLPLVQSSSMKNYPGPSCWRANKR